MNESEQRIAIAKECGEKKSGMGTDQRTNPSPSSPTQPQGGDATCPDQERSQLAMPLKGCNAAPEGSNPHGSGRHRQMNRVLFSSASPHWATPKALYRELDSEFHFNYDPCPLNTPIFSESWKGRRVFCNPPYGPGIKPFLRRASEADLAVFLLPSRTDTKWFHELVLPFATEIRFVKGRLLFSENGDLSRRATFPSVIVIYKNNTSAARKDGK